MALQMLRLTQETTYNTFQTSAPSNQQALIYLPMGDGCTIQKTPMYIPLRDAGQGNRMTRRLLGRYTVGGSIKTPLFPSQAALLLGWASTFVGTTPCLNLHSFTVDRVMFLDDTCTPIYQRTTGCKIDKFDLMADATDSGFLLNCSIDVMGSIYDDTITVTDFPTPSYTSYPVDNPYEFFHLAGNLTINAARTNFSSFSLSIDNILKSFAQETPNVGNIDYFGRDITWSSKVKYKSAADRQTWNTGALFPVSAEFNNGAHSVTFNLEASNSFTGVGDSMPIDDYFTQTISGQALLDQTANTDLAITIA